MAASIHTADKTAECSSVLKVDCFLLSACSPKIQVKVDDSDYKKTQKNGCNPEPGHRSDAKCKYKKVPHALMLTRSCAQLKKRSQTMTEPGAGKSSV